MTPDDPRHGEERGYYAHRKAGQEPCDPCKKAHMRAEKVRAMKRLHPKPPVNQIGLVRRLRALARLGWTAQRLGEELGVSHELIKSVLRGGYRWTVGHDIEKRIRDGYERLCMTLPPMRGRNDDSAATRQRQKAIANGWPPPLAWDDIDNPDEVPATDTERTTWKRDELVNEFYLLVRTGSTHKAAAERLHVTPKAIEKAIARQKATEAA